MDGFVQGFLLNCRDDRVAGLVVFFVHKPQVHAHDGREFLGFFCKMPGETRAEQNYWKFQLFFSTLFTTLSLASRKFTRLWFFEMIIKPSSTELWWSCSISCSTCCSELSQVSSFWRVLWASWRWWRRRGRQKSSKTTSSIDSPRERKLSLLMRIWCFKQCCLRKFSRKLSMSPSTWWSLWLKLVG